MPGGRGGRIARRLALLPGLVLPLALLASCDLTDPGPVPATLVVVPSELWLDALGAQRNMEVLVRDEAGGRVQGVPVEWTSADPGVVSISATGRTRAEAEGTTTVTARFGELAATATVRVERVARRVELLGGGEQSDRAGRRLAEPVTVRVTDRLGTPMPGVDVRFEAALGGSASPATAVADASGVASTEWTLGPEPGTQSLKVTVGVRHTFHIIADARDEEGRVPFRIRLSFLGEPGPLVRDAFRAAAARWEPLLAEKLVPVLVRVGAGRCGGNAPALDDVVDDLLVFVTAEPLDGPGGIAAAAAPCFLRQEGMLPVAGQVRVDSDDVETLHQLGVLEDVATHEIGHVLGVGSLWELFELLEEPSFPDSPGADTHFTGPRAVAAFDATGGADYAGAKVPVENEEGGEGTRDRHWRQSVLAGELMASFLRASGGNALSRITLGSLADLGYAVDEAAAEPFTLTPPGVTGLRDEGPGFRLLEGRLDEPVLVLDPAGRVVRTLRPR